MQKRERPQPVRVAIDLETTGLRPDQDAIIEIGAVKFAGGQVIETFQSFVAPNAQLPFRIQRLTGIRPGQLNGAPTLSALLPRLRAFLGNAPLVGHSVQFDAAFLRRAGLARHNPLIDTYELATLLLPGLPSYTLATVGAALAIPASTYHRALADAQLARAVFLALSARLTNLDPSTLRSLGRLAASPEWTPLPLLRAALAEQSRERERLSGGNPFGALLQTSLGQQLQAKLGVDPETLSMAVAMEGAGAEPRADARSTPKGAPVHADQGAAQAPGVYVEAVAPPATQLEVTARRHAVSAGVAARLAEGGASFFEVERNDESALAMLTPVVEWVVASGGRALIVAANDDQMARVARSLMPQALARASVALADAPVAELDEYETYLCLHRWFGVARDARGATFSQDLTRGLAKLVVWSRETRRGARSEITLTGQESLAWERARAGGDFADTATECAYQRGGYCFTARARHDAAHAAIVVTTHAALAAHLAGRPSLLPDLPDATRVVILDAHLLEEQLLQAGSIALDRRATLDLLATVAAASDAEPDGAGDQAPARTTYTGLLPLAGALLASAPGQPHERGAQAIAQWKPTARERGWLETLARARSACDALFAALRVAMQEAQSASQGGEQDQNSQRDQGAGRQNSRRETPEQRATTIDAHTRQLDAWQETLTAWATLADALADVATLARDVAEMIRATQGAKRPATAGQSVSGAKRKGALVASNVADAPTIPAEIANGLIADLLAAGRRLDQTRAHGAILFASPAQGDNYVRWLRLPYAEPFGADARNRRINGYGNANTNGYGNRRLQPGAWTQTTPQSSRARHPTQPGKGGSIAAESKAPISTSALADAPVNVNATEADATEAVSAMSSAPAPASDTDAALNAPLDVESASHEASDASGVSTIAAAMPFAAISARQGSDGRDSAPLPVEPPSAEAPTEAEGEPPTLHAAPLEVGGLLAPLLAPGRALALAGWSLSVGGDFEYMRGSLGLPEGAGDLSYTPDYAHQTLLCLPDDAPEPNAQHFQHRLDEAIIALATALDGDLVALFPSHASLRAGALGVKRALERHDILALAQGVDGSARQLWQTFHTQPRTVLLGAGAFWDGADQRERPPACVVVTRLPFPPTGDPLVAARSERWSDPQTMFVIPNAALKLRQALGGLAWSHQRRNAVVLYDHRVQTRAYGPTILGALPRCAQAQEPMARLVERVADWTHSAV